MFVVLIEWTSVLILGIFIISQLILPAFRNRPLFPSFRRVTRTAKGITQAIGNLNDQQELQKLKHVLDEKIKKIKEDENE